MEDLVVISGEAVTSELDFSLKSSTLAHKDARVSRGGKCLALAGLVSSLLIAGLVILGLNITSQPKGSISPVCVAAHASIIAALEDCATSILTAAQVARVAAKRHLFDHIFCYRHEHVQPVVCGCKPSCPARRGPFPGFERVANF